MNEKIVLAEAVDLCWYVDSPRGEPRFPPRWDPDEALGRLDSDSLGLLEELNARRQSLSLGASPSAGTRGDMRKGQPADGLRTTLLMATLSEHYLDKLLVLPPRIRDRRLQEAAELIDVDVQELTRFHSEWWAHYRDRVYGGTK